MDGETDLKSRRALAATSKMMASEPELTSSLRGILDCDPPNKEIYEFTGTLQLSTNDSLSLGISKIIFIVINYSLALKNYYSGPEQLLQRGARLRNTAWVVGIVVYTGHETKLLKNLSLSAPSKVFFKNFYNLEFSAKHYD